MTNEDEMIKGEYMVVKIFADKPIEVFAYDKKLIKVEGKTVERDDEYLQGPINTYHQSLWYCGSPLCFYHGGKQYCINRGS